MSAQGEAYLSADDPDFGWEFAAEDFVYARLAEDLATAERLPDPADRKQTINHVQSLRLAVTLHSTYVDKGGRSHACCSTCHGSEGFPCSTLRFFTRMWRHHPDYQPGWNETMDGPDGPSWWSRDITRVAERGGFRNDFLAEQAQEQTPPTEGDQVT